MKRVKRDVVGGWAHAYVSAQHSTLVFTEMCAREVNGHLRGARPSRVPVPDRDATAKSNDVVAAAAAASWSPSGAILAVFAQIRIPASTITSRVEQTRSVCMRGCAGLVPSSRIHNEGGCVCVEE